MKTKPQSAHHLLEQLNCFGDYTKTNPLCAKHCALRLRCAIEQGQHMQMELLEELIDSEALPTKIQ
jgi:hypothetical protein